MSRFFNFICDPRLVVGSHFGAYNSYAHVLLIYRLYYAYINNTYNPFAYRFCTGIGLDNMFILVSSWRYTSVHLLTEERVARMLKDSAVSITITTLTDALAFGAGKWLGDVNSYVLKRGLTAKSSCFRRS